MQTDYSIYHFSKKEIAVLLVEGLFILTVFALLFYDSPIAILAGSPFLYFFYKKQRVQKARKQRECLLLHFKEAILSILSSLRAGYSVENAFVEACQDLRIQFGEQDCMVRELLNINRNTANNIPVETSLMNLALRSGCEDVQDFAQIFVIAKRTGGDMGKIIEKTASMISQRIEMREEILTLLASKRYEQRVMNLVPLGIIAYIGFSNPGYFDPLYHNLSGAVIMTAIIACYLFSLWLSDRILSIPHLS